ncbi:MAG: hypothetical protein K0S45_1797 [Nitrospira sp.]|jgi:hypothetical protein|nr:hypothetical protein [Nitrospira sp.]
MVSPATPVQLFHSLHNHFATGYQAAVCLTAAIEVRRIHRNELDT